MYKTFYNEYKNLNKKYLHPTVLFMIDAFN